VPAHVRQVRTGKAVRFNVMAAGDRRTRPCRIVMARHGWNPSNGFVQERLMPPLNAKAAKK